MRRRATRREFLQLPGAVATGGLAGILASRHAPGYAQRTAIHWLRWNDFVPTSDRLLRNKIAPEAAKALGVALTNRKLWFADASPADDEAFDSWESYIAAGKKMKSNGRSFGQTLGRTFGDAPTFWYPYLWSWDGTEVEADGKTVVLNSLTIVDSVKFAVAACKDAYDEGGLAWDDSSNNHAFLTGTLSSALNGASMYLEAKRKPDSYQTPDGKPLKEDIFHSVSPVRSAGQYSYHVSFSSMLMGYSKNQKAGKEFLRRIGSPQICALWFGSQQGFSVGATSDWEKSRVWEEDPVMGPYRLAARSGRYTGYAGPSGRSAAEAVTKYIIVDMYAKAVQGMAPEDSVKWAH